MQTAGRRGVERIKDDLADVAKDVIQPQRVGLQHANGLGLAAAIALGPHIVAHLPRHGEVFLRLLRRQYVAAAARGVFPLRVAGKADEPRRAAFVGKRGRRVFAQPCGVAARKFHRVKPAQPLFGQSAVIVAGEVLNRRAVLAHNRFVLHAGDFVFSDEKETAGRIAVL